MGEQAVVEMLLGEKNAPVLGVYDLIAVQETKLIQSVVLIHKKRRHLT